MAEVKFKVVSKAKGCSIWVDDEAVDLVNGEASAKLEAGDHKLSWTLIGAGGVDATFTATLGATELFKVVSTIPPGEGSHKNFKLFKIK